MENREGCHWSQSSSEGCLQKHAVNSCLPGVNSKHLLGSDYGCYKRGLWTMSDKVFGLFVNFKNAHDSGIPPINQCRMRYSSCFMKAWNSVNVTWFLMYICQCFRVGVQYKLRWNEIRRWRIKVLGCVFLNVWRNASSLPQNRRAESCSMQRVVT